MILPFFLAGQRTFIPDDAFEQALINLDLDDIFDDSVYTSAIDTVDVLYISNEDIVDLTGIEDFTLLTKLFCYDNQLQILDLSNNPNLQEVSCSNNQLVSMDVRNGDNFGLWYCTSTGNTSLNCIDVDEVGYAYYTWSYDTWTQFSNNCNTTAISELNVTRRLIKIVDLFGREVTKQINQPLFYVYDDGTVEKRIAIE